MLKTLPNIESGKMRVIDLEGFYGKHPGPIVEFEGTFGKDGKIVTYRREISREGIFYLEEF